MPFTLFQTGGDLRTVNTDGGLSPVLTLPPGVTLATNRQPRFARFKRYAIVVNTPTRPLIVSPDGVVYPLTLTAPAGAVTLSAGAAGTLSGTYLSLQTYEILDALGNVITSSDYGPAMTTPVTITNKKLHAAFAVSPDTQVNNNHIFRTTTNGAIYFSWTSTNNNTSTSIENDISDAALGVIEAPALGPAPDLTLIAEWQGRLWGVDRVAIDDLRWTESGTAYAWSALNTLPIPHVGSDGAGITALIPRRAALGVTRRDLFVQVTGSTRANFAPTVVNGGEQVGCVSQESVVVFNDIAYFLFRDGVYRWDSNGITCITDTFVRSWFTTDTYFNRSMFWRAFAALDPIGKKYRLFLASKGSSVIDRWIEYDLLTSTWWGPHKTDAFTPSSAFLVAGRNQQPFFMIGSREGYISQDQEEKNDWGLSPIALSVKTKSHDGDEPDRDKFYGELSVIGPIQPAGVIQITPALGQQGGEINNTILTPFAYDMTKGRQRLGRLGTGNSMTLQFDHDTINEDVVLEGYEVAPLFTIGRR